jgi:competence protein ComEA
MTSDNTQTLGAIAASPSVFFLNGNNGYAINANRVTLHAEQINSPGNFSGELSLQLWALNTLFNGSQLCGQQIASLTLGTLLNGNYFANIEEEMDAQLPVDGSYQMVLALVEAHNGIEYLHDWRGYAQTETFTQAPINTPIVVVEEPIVAVEEPIVAVEEPIVAVEEPIISTDAPIATSEAVTVEDIAEPTATVTAAVSQPSTSEEVAPKRVVSPRKKAASKKAKQAIAAPAQKTKRAAANSKTSTKKSIQPKAGIVSINHGSLEEVAALRGLSRSVAERIIEGRPYKQKKDLLKIKGIGEKMLETIKPQIKLS